MNKYLFRLHTLLACRRGSDPLAHGERRKTEHEIADYLADAGYPISWRTVEGWFGGRPISPLMMPVIDGWIATLSRAPTKR